MHIPPLGELERAPLETARLLILPLTVGLASEMFDALDASRKEMDRWQNFSHWTHVEHVRSALAASVKQWDAGTDARFAMVRRSDGAFLGNVGIEDVNGMHVSANLAYWIRTDAARRGYTVEAARALIGWGFGRVGLHRLHAVVAVGNEASVGVVRRLGFTLEGRMREAERIGPTWHDAFVFGLLEDDDRPSSRPAQRGGAGQSPEP